jgi:microcystin-dependent protein
MIKIKGRLRAALTVGLLYLAGGSFAMGGTLLPNGEQYFTDNNGLPLSAGCVFFYTPGTLSPKNTYQDAAQTVANTNPVQLDAAGRAIVYGSGTYRQIVTSTGSNAASPCSPAGTQIWDQITASTDSSATIYAGASSGTPNAITVTAPAFTGTDGQVINYISTNTNTGGATLNPSGYGAIQIVRDSSTGPAALTGGELVATNAVSVIYDATAGTFHILSPVTWPNTAGVPVGTVVPFPGFTAPTGYAFAYGQAVSRTTYASLMAAYTSAQTASLSSGSPTITGLSDTTQFARGQAIEAIGIPASTTIQSCTSSTCTLSANATSTRTGTVTVFPYGNGDGSTTFNLPDFRGRTLFGRDNQGGTAANVSQLATTLTTTSASTSATVGSATGLAIGMSLSGNSNVPAGTTISAISGTTLTLSQAATATQSNVSTRFSIFPDAQGLGVSGGALTRALVTSNLPPYTPSGSVTVNSITSHVKTGAFAGTDQSSFLVVGNTAGTTLPDTSAWFASGSATFAGSAQGGSSIPFGTIGPSSVINWAVRLTQ